MDGAILEKKLLRCCRRDDSAEGSGQQDNNPKYTTCAPMGLNQGGQLQPSRSSILHVFVPASTQKSLHYRSSLFMIKAYQCVKMAKSNSKLQFYWKYAVRLES